MKSYIYYIFILFFLISCNNRIIDKRYVYIDADKEHEFEFFFFKDSTFIIKDFHGCNQMAQKGKWKQLIEDSNNDYVNYVLYDTTKVLKYTNIHGKVSYSFVSNFNKKRFTINEDHYFPVISTDTVSFVKKDKVFFLRGLTFTKSNKKLSRERVKILEKRLIEKIGKEMYIKTIGEGVSLKKARENLSYCK